MLLAQREILSLVRLPVPPLQLHVDSNSGKHSWQGMSEARSITKGIDSQLCITMAGIDQTPKG
jgi:hypothetical protein